MNLTRHPALVEQLAAGYALGTLRGGARRRFETLARAEAPVRAAALIWEARLASVAELQPQSVPSPAVWKRVENLLNAEKEAKAMQAARLPAPSSGQGWWASLPLWRGLGAFGTTAAVLAVVVGADLRHLNANLTGQVRELSAKLSATPEIRYVAVLADDQSAAAMLVTFDARNQKMVVKRVGGFQEQPDKSLQLWALPQGGSPQSLGVLGSEAVLRLQAPGNDVREVPALAISLEPKGGVPAGSGPSGPVLFKGRLLETSL